MSSCSNVVALAGGVELCCCASGGSPADRGSQDLAACWQPPCLCCRPFFFLDMPELSSAMLLHMSLPRRVS